MNGLIGKKYRFNGIFYDPLLTKRAVLYIERDYITCNKEINFIAGKIDEGITGIESYLNMHITYPILYFLKSGKFISYSRGQKIVLSGIKQRKSPYLHETVHAVAGPVPHRLWFSEGLAVYLNEKLSGFPCFPNGLRPLEVLAKKRYKEKTVFQTELDSIGCDGYIKFKNKIARRVFYIFAGSFVQFLDKTIGTEKLIRNYRAVYIEDVIFKTTGLSLGQLKKEWEQTLN